MKVGYCHNLSWQTDKTKGMNSQESMLRRSFMLQRQMFVHVSALFKKAISTKIFFMIGTAVKDDCIPVYPTWHSNPDASQF